LWFEKKITTNGEFLPKQTNSTIVFVNKQLISLDNILYREEEKFKRGSFFINICAAVFTIFVPCHLKKNNFIQYLLVVYNTQTFDRTSPKLLYLLYTPYYPSNQKSSKKKKKKFNFFIM